MFGKPTNYRAGRLGTTATGIRVWLLVLSVIVPARVEAGAWTRPRGSGYLKLSYNASSANDQFGFDGRSRPIVPGLDDYPFADRSFYLYGEYGITGRITAIALVPLKRIYVHDRLYRYRTTGLGDLGTGIRWRGWTRGAWVVSLTGSTTIPTDYHRGTEPPLGPGRFDFTATAEAGRSFYPRPGYVNAGVGYRYRSTLQFSKPGGANAATAPTSPGDYADQVLGTVETGWTVRSRLHVGASAREVYAVHTDENAFSITSIPTSERYTKLGGELAIDVRRPLSLSFSAFKTVAGRNTARSIDLELGASTSW